MLRSLTPRAFRNLADQPFAPVPGRQLLLGGNGAGKTSLLEAVYLVATSRSFRAADLTACLRHGELAFHLAALAGDEGRAQLELGWQRGRRLRLADGVELPLARHAALQPLVLWSSEESELLAGSPEHGRRLVDRGLVSTQPRALGVFGRYRQLLDQKRQLLATGKRPGLETWNDLLAVAAAELVAMRAAYVDTLAAALAVVCARGVDDLPTLGIEYLPSPRVAGDGEAAIRAALERVAAREIERQQPLIGPHRDGLRLLWGGRDAKLVASAGEAKAFGLLLAVAQGALVAATGREPLLLLDDVDAELDPQRLASLWEVLAPGSQVLATSSRPEVWKGLQREATWRVERGAVTAG